MVILYLKKLKGIYIKLELAVIYNLIIARTAPYEFCSNLIIFNIFGYNKTSFVITKKAARGDLVVPGRRTEWGSRSFAVAGPKCWNKIAGWTRRDLSGWS